MDKFLVLRYSTDSKTCESAALSREIFYISKNIERAIEHTCNKLRQRQKEGEKITFKPCMILVKGQYYQSIKVEGSRILENYYIIPFSPVSIQGYV